MLEIEDIHASYGKVKVLFGVSLTARSGEILCIMGRNGAGKTTVLRTIMGLLKPTGGKIEFEDRNISSLPAHEIPKLGIGYVPQGRRLFPELTVDENLTIGMQVRNSKPAIREWVLDIFPRLRERLNQQSNTLSGGEQQMLATARALCIKPKVLLLDEPTEGLQPSMIEMIQQVITRLKSEGLAVVLVEQRLDSALSLADQVVVLENGENRETMNKDDASSNGEKIRGYLGV